MHRNRVLIWMAALVVTACWHAAPAQAADEGKDSVDSKDPVVRLLARIDQLEKRIAVLEKRLAEEHPVDPLSATGKFASDVVGGTLNAAGQAMDATGRALTGQPQKQPAKSDESKSKPKNTFFGIPIE